MRVANWLSKRVKYLSTNFHCVSYPVLPIRPHFLRPSHSHRVETINSYSNHPEDTMDLNLASMRAKYNDEHSNFTEDKLTSLNPFTQFHQWMEEAKLCPKIEEGNAMCISTVSSTGRPSSRMVLLKGFSEETGFRFFTNYTSRKGM